MNLFENTMKLTMMCDMCVYLPLFGSPLPTLIRTETKSISIMTLTDNFIRDKLPNKL